MEAPDHCNYIEVIFLDRKKQNAQSVSANENEIKINVSDEYFSECMAKIKRSNYKYFQKSFKTYVANDNLYLENAGHQDLKVYSKDILKVTNNEDNTLSLFCHRDKKPYHVFPSTTKMYSVYYTNRLTFRISNRIYMNFDVQYYFEDKTEVKKIFINYNHDHNVDLDHMTMSLEATIKNLLP